MREQEQTFGDTRKLAELIKDIRVAMMQTFRSGGSAQEPAGPVDGEVPPIHVRPMYTQNIDPERFQGELWFFTNSTSAKVMELRRNNRVVLTYAAPDKNHFVVVWGTAVCEHNEEKAKELWNIHAKGWWPEGPESDRLTVIRVDISSAEYWDGPSNASYMFKLAKAVATGEQIKTYGEHGVVRAN